MSRILVVEDADLNREFLRRLLARRGFEVLGAENAERGLAAAREERPDLILMDIGLPGMDGWEATRRLKADPVTRAIPVIALTAYSRTADREQCFAAGCDDFQTKPVDMERLVAGIQALLDRAPRH